MEVLYVWPNKDSSSKTVAEFGICIPEWDLTFNKMRLVKTLNGNIFVSAPSYKCTSREGKEEYKEYFAFGKSTKSRFNQTVLEAVKAFIEKNNIQLNIQESPSAL
jgi:uridine kinase